MKKIIGHLFLIFLAIGCAEPIANEDLAADIETAIEPAVFVPTERTCASVVVLEQDMIEDPGLALRMEEIESFTERTIAEEAQMRTNGTQASITIPVVVHVIYRRASENISNAQIQSQIDILNQDFNLANADKTKVPALFKDLRADVEITFDWQYINRVKSSKVSWSTNNDMKRSAKGGADAYQPTEFLNIWVVNSIDGGILGFATFPGGNSINDGVVIGHRYFGNTGTAVAPYNKGRTATHEVGHWMNLKHIWGDGGCNVDDGVQDTPVSNQPNYGCPSYPTRNCNSVDMTMNYMDYTDDKCMQMFSLGQKARMRAIFNANGPRASFGS